MTTKNPHERTIMLATVAVMFIGILSAVTISSINAGRTAAMQETMTARNETKLAKASLEVCQKNIVSLETAVVYQTDIVQVLKAERDHAQSLVAQSQAAVRAQLRGPQGLDEGAVDKLLVSTLNRKPQCL